MTTVLLNNFYDLFQYNIGWVISYVFIGLMTLELLIVMAKYLGGNKK